MLVATSHEGQGCVSTPAKSKVRVSAVMFEGLLKKSIAQGLQDSFFIHCAPKLGREDSGKEIVWFGDGQQSGTTDFPFMLRGAIKEVGVLALLNHYTFRRTGKHPLGEAFMRAKPLVT